MLHGRILINGQTITGYKIVRLPRQPFPREDTIFTYKWEVQHSFRGRLYKAEGTLQHRYGDGAELLVARVLKIASPQLWDQHPPDEQIEHDGDAILHEEKSCS